MPKLISNGNKTSRKPFTVSDMSIWQNVFTQNVIIAAKDSHTAQLLNLFNTYQTLPGALRGKSQPTGVRGTGKIHLPCFGR